MKKTGKGFFQMGLMVVALVAMPVTGRGGVWYTEETSASDAYDSGHYQEAIRICDEAFYIGEVDADLYRIRAKAYWALMNYPKAKADYAAALKIMPQNADIYWEWAKADQKKGDYAEAMVEYRQAIKHVPTTRFGLVDVYNELAWLLATCPEAKYRDGDLAVKTAKEAWKASLRKASPAPEVMAAAYAEAGDFANAVIYEQEFLAIPSLDGKQIVAAKERLALYQAGKPYRERK